jgi:hypothetical protein
MVASEKDVEGSDESRRKLIIVVAVVAALVIAGFFYFLLRASSGSNVEPTLEGAIRPGSPEWDQFQKIVLDEPEADEAKRALGDIVMNLQTTVRNFTGRTLNGLEIKGAVIDHAGKPVKERTVVVIPGRQRELEPNKTMLVTVRLEGMSERDDRANIRMEVTGFKFKQ